MYLRHIYFGIMLIQTPINSVIVQAESLQDKTHDKNQYIYYNVHPNPPHQEEGSQLNAIADLLAKRETMNDEHLDVIVEQPLSVARLFDQQPRITGDLQKNIKERLCTKTTILQEEIRCASLGAIFMLQEQIDPQTIFPHLEFENTFAKYFVENITFNNLIEEYHFHREKMESFINQNKSLLNQEISLLERYFTDFEKILKKDDISENSSILDYAKILKYTNDKDKRKNLLNKISQLFAHLFDLHLFKLMYLRLQNNKKAMLICGYLHALKVSQMLRQTTDLEISKIYSTRYDPFSGGIIEPLQPNQLGLFLEGSSWQLPCVIC